MLCNMQNNSKKKNLRYVIFLSHTILLKAVMSHTWILFFPQPSDFEILFERRKTASAAEPTVLEHSPLSYVYLVLVSLLLCEVIP